MSKKIYRFLFFLLLLTFYHKSYSSHQDTLKLSDTTSSRASQYFYKALNYFPENVERSILYNKEALKTVNHRLDPELNANVNKLMGELFEKKNNIQPAINYYLISAKIYKGLSKPEMLCKVYEKLGQLYFHDNYNLERALFYNNKALEIAVKLDNSNLIARIYNQIGGIFFNQNNIDEASIYFAKALNLWKKVDNSDGIAKSYNNIGEIYRVNNQPEKAVEYYNKSLKINKEIGSIYNKAVNYENLGIVERMQGNNKEAFRSLEKSLSLYTKENHFDDKLKVMLLIGDEYVALKNYHKAFKLYKKVYRLSKQKDQWNYLSTVAKGLSEVFEKTGHPIKALHYFKIHSQYKDSIHNKKQKEQITDLQTHFLNDIQEKEIKIKDNEITLLQREKKIKQLQFYFLIAGLIVLVIIASLLISRYRSQIKKERLLSLKNKELHKAQRELMELEIKSKDNDLVNFAFHLVEKNNFLKEIKIQLKNLNSYPEDEKSKKIKELIANVQQILQVQQQLEQLKYKVNQTYQGFFRRLKKRLPSITKNEERLCALLRLNLSSKEIAALNNISIKAVEMSRYRLRKKCGIGNNENLCDYLEEI